MVRYNTEDFTTTVKQTQDDSEERFEPVVEEFDSNGSLIGDGGRADIYARRVMLGDGMTYHVPMDIENKLLEVHSGETMKDKDRKRNTPKFELKQVSPTAFDRYMEYLRNHKPVSYRNAQREV